MTHLKKKLGEKDGELKLQNAKRVAAPKSPHAKRE
jgi:hypothetical protein